MGGATNEKENDYQQQQQQQQKRWKVLRRMGTLRGRLRKARQQITWCAFPVRRKTKTRFETYDDDDNCHIDDDDIYESAVDVRNPNEVGHTCRGSVNMQDAQVILDKQTNAIVISAASQTFHVKAQTETDRKQWMNKLTYARHQAIKTAESEEDEDAKLSFADLTRADVLVISNKELAEKLGESKNAVLMWNKQNEEFMKTFLHADGIDRHLMAERTDLLKITADMVLKSFDEFVEMSEKRVKKLTKLVDFEQKEKKMLQEQLEELAKQHSSLERAATICSTRGGAGGAEAAPISAYSCGSDDDEFHDAEEELRNSSISDYQSAPIEMISSSAESTSSESTACTVIKKGRARRTTVPERPDLPINLWSIMKNCIGKELSKIPMPVNFSEPLSVLQRVTEDLEYANLLEEAATLPSLEQMCYVAAYSASNYSTTCHRTNKPFNPLLGETYECDRMDDLGWRSITEQVSHHPPAAAHHATGRGWTMYQDFTMTSRFRGKYLSVIPVGLTHVVFDDQNHYSYRKITTTVHNIIVGKLWIDNHGDMEITNHRTGEKCVLKFIPYSYFSRDTPRKVYGIVRDAAGQPKFVVQGTWDKSIDMFRVSTWNGNLEKPKVEIDETSLKRIWTCKPLPKGAEKMHNFTSLAIELNEPEDGIAPTDSRRRPDQRLMEDGRWDESNRKKLEIEEKQRVVRRRREADIEKAMQRGEHYEEYQPTWFNKVQDELNGALIHQYKGGYWEAKQQNDWSKCPDIF